MAEMAVGILNSDEERKRLGRRGREIAITRFATEKIIPQYEELYRRISGQ
jgi:glycosyltransferase involved in cell wall biosynthesis